MLYIENPETAAKRKKKLLEVINSVKWQYTKLIPRNWQCFYTQKEKFKKTPFTIIPKIIKYLGISLTKEVKDLYSNYETPMKEIKDDTNGDIFYAF